MYIADNNLKGMGIDRIEKDIFKPKSNHWKAVNLNKLRFIRDKTPVGVSVIGYPFNWFRIYDITVEDILKLIKNPTGSIIFRNIDRYGEGTEICERCQGFGVLDWVSNVVQSKRRHPNQEDYKNFELEVIVKHYKKATDELVYYSTTPKLRPGENYCERCYGSGFYLHTDGAPVEFFTSTGHTYQRYSI